MTVINGYNSIWSGSKHKEEAWKFLKFYSGPEGSEMLSTHRNCVPGLKVAAHFKGFLAPPSARSR